MLAGAHVSISGGLDQAIDRGCALGVNAIQTFASSPRTLHFSPTSDDGVQKYLTKRLQSPISFHLFHGIYLINLAHENPRYVDVCVESLSHYQELAGTLGVFGTIFHVGSHKGAGLAMYLDQIAKAIAQVLVASPPKVWLLLENAAGQKGTIGNRFDDLKMIIEAVQKLHVSTDYLGLGVDTQHAFASGYDLRGNEGLETLLADIDNSIGLSKLQVVHVNDSLPPLGSNKDRHANLGEGEIGIEGLSYIVNHPRLRHLPMILEVPGAKEGVRLSDVAALKALSLA